MNRLPRPFLLCLLALLVAACAPAVLPAGPAIEQPRVTRNYFDHAFFVAPDGARLPMQVWRPGAETEVRAVVIALHGMNDYANAFALPGPVWAERGIVTYAIDQRGFGGNVPRGIWPGTETLTADLSALAAFVRARHPDTPVYALGVSMGGAVVMAALGSENPPDVDGAILVAPAVWAPETMPRVMRASLWLAAHTVGSATLTGRNLDRWPTDNVEILRAMARDARVQKETRIDALYGLAGLMGDAFAAAPALGVPVLLLYGERDQIVPRGPIRQVIRRLPLTTRVAIYEHGYHMLLRDRQRAVVHRDIAHWILDRESGAAGLPSGADARDAFTILNRPRPAYGPPPGIRAERP